MPCAVPQIGALHQQEFLGAIGDIQQEWTSCGSSLDTLLHHLKLNVDDPAQFLFTERSEDDDVVQAVDELRRKLPASSLDPCARNAGAEGPVATGILGRRHVEAEAWSD